jgi:hypothetical protein
LDSRTTPAGINRRELIKRAAAAGAIAWTAPVIVDSLASPAGALTLNECYRAQFDRDGASFVEVEPDNGAGCVPTTCWNNRTQFPPGFISISGSDLGDWTFTITTPGCIFLDDSQARIDQGNNCFCSTSGAGTNTITFPGSDDGDPYDRFKLIVQCAGVSCSPCTNTCP